MGIYSFGITHALLLRSSRAIPLSRFVRQLELLQHAAIEEMPSAVTPRVRSSMGDDCEGDAASLIL